MPTILLKKSDTPGSVPGTANLTNLAGGAEVAVNTADKRMFSMTSASAVVELGTNPSSLTCADGSFVLLKAASASITNLTATSLVLSNLSIASANITTLTSSSATISTTLALSGGTANGVLYLNGSKVATSGSALTFNGTTLTASTGGPKIFEAISAGTASYSYNTVGANSSIFGLDSTGTIVGNLGTAPIYFYINSAEQMRLTSTGLGIGTSSPANKLTIYQSQNADTNARIYNDNAGTAAEANLYITNSNADNTGFFAGVGGTGFTTAGGFVQDGAWLGSGSGASGGLSIITRADAPIRFYTNGHTNERMRLDSSGNLGLGVTPSAWGSGYKAFQEHNIALWTYTGGSNLYLSSNLYYDGTNFKYLTSDYATYYRQLSGAHTWYYAASGTAGNTISFTQAMTLDASGNLLVGKTTTYGDEIAAFYESANGSRYLYVENPNAGTSAVAIINVNAGSGGDLRMAAYGANHSTQANNASLFNHKITGSLLFGTEATERARITSGGYFGIGTTSPGYRLEVFETGSVNVVQIKGDATDGSSLLRMWQAAGSGDNGFIAFLTQTSGTETVRGTIDYNRAGGQVRYNTTSDYRAKEVYGPIEDSGEQIDALKVYRGKMLGATQERPMMIAHEAQEVVPYAVGGEKDAVDEDGKPKYQTMDHQILVPLLIAELQSLRKRVAELETK